MHVFKRREDGIEVNKLICEHEGCKQRKFVIYNTEKQIGLIDSNWKVVEYLLELGEVQMHFCPYHKDKY